MAEPISIITTVLKVVTTSVTTVQTISNYTNKYNMADLQIVAMNTECATVRMALLEIQRLVIQNRYLQELDHEDDGLAYVQNDY